MRSKVLYETKSGLHSLDAQLTGRNITPERGISTGNLAAPNRPGLTSIGHQAHDQELLRSAGRV